ncbi:MAG: hypothetical protein ACP5NI_00600 [Acetobacteraceae bacterium]
MAERPLAEPPAPAELAMCFESLGENCEFGLFQRYMGAEPLGFFRFNSTRLAALRAVLANRFADIAAPGRVRIEMTAGREFLVKIAPEEFSYHTFIREGEMAAEDLLARERQRIAFLARKFLEELEAGEKILVRKDNTGVAEEEMRDLAGMLRGFGPNTLLWVAKADAAHPPGHVERIGPGLLKGHLGWFAPLGIDVHAIDAESWLIVCRNAWRLLHSPEIPWLAPDRAPAAANLLPDSALLRAPGWRGGAGAETEIVPPPPLSGHAVIRHQLRPAAAAAASHVFSGDSEEIKGGRILCASCWVLLPGGEGARRVWITLIGRPAMVIRRADPRRRGVWQRIWSSARARPDQGVLRAALTVSGPAGSVVYSTAWRLEEAVVPSVVEAPPEPPDLPARVRTARERGREFVLVFDGAWRQEAADGLS